MAEGIRRHRPLFTVLALAVLIVSVVVVTGITATAAESPRRGGVLLAAIGADAPSLDPHQESTFATLQPTAPLYSTLLQIDPYRYPNVIGDVASEWTIAPDGLTYTFKLRQGIRFHDGSPLTAADVKASYDKIVFPPQGVRSPRKVSYPAIAAVEAPDSSTVVLDPAERKKLVIELQKLVLENVYYMPGLWWTRNVVHWAKVKNYIAPPSHFTNQKLQDVWLSED